MKWSKVRLIFLREVRDQLRDRRTLFTIAVLPLLLYPLIGMTFLQVAQFLKEHETRIRVIGAAGLPERPALFDGGKFARPFCPPQEARLLELTIDETLPPEVQRAVRGQSRRAGAGEIASGRQTVPPALRALAQRQIEDGTYDAIIYFPPDFAAKLAQLHRALRRQAGGRLADRTADPASVPEPVIFVNKASDKSRIAFRRVDGVLERWRQAIIRQSLEENKIPVAATRPFELVDADVAEEVSRRAAVWSKILPFIVLVWALTGAFYPAIDLCAGEKERGTLETLLSSPAERNEIVWGKLLTIMSFSIATALLNLISMGLTGLFIIRQIGQAGQAAARVQIGPPPLGSIGWLVLASVPVAALFSALSLAVAALARSSKEGQYYLMPLLLISLPLMMLPMLPAAELDLGTSLIPVTGMILLLRELIEGRYLDAVRFSVPVLGVTALCCWLAIRWAVSQFNNESVLFRESERWGPRLWLRHLVRDRGPTPTFGAAMTCGVVLLLIRFFAGLTLPQPGSWSAFVVSTLVMQIALIATPALLMTVMLTRSPARTLMLRPPTPIALPAAALLALLLHPLMVALAEGVQQLYPFSDEARMQLQSVQNILARAPSPWLVVALIALVPAICEEVAFRGFILSGLWRSGHKWAAIVISSVFFGAVHFVLQQSLTACVVGVVIGYVAVQTGSLFPAMLFHLTYNGLSLALGQMTAELIERHPILRLIYQPDSGGFGYHVHLLVIGSLLSAALLWWFQRLGCPAVPRGKITWLRGSAP